MKQGHWPSQKGRNTRIQVKATSDRLLLRQGVMMIMDTENLVRGRIEVASQSPFKDTHSWKKEEIVRSWDWQPSRCVPADSCSFGEEEKGGVRVV